MIYSGPAYQMGATQIGGQLGAADALAVTSSEKSQAEHEIKKMRAALAKWLKYRNLLAMPPTQVPPTEFSPVEVRLGKRLYVLLCEMFDPRDLPPADGPLAPIELAKIAVAGKLPTEGNVAGPSAVGFFWMWPAVAVVGLVLLTVVTKVRSDAETAQEERRIECIEAGKCTDTGFWMKAGAMAIIAYLAWEKFGLKESFGRSR